MGRIQRGVATLALVGIAVLGAMVSPPALKANALHGVRSLHAGVCCGGVNLDGT